MTGNQAHAQLRLLIENCTTRLYFLLPFIVNLQGNFMSAINKTFGVCLDHIRHPMQMLGCTGTSPGVCLTPTTAPGCFFDCHKALNSCLVALPHWWSWLWPLPHSADLGCSLVPGSALPLHRTQQNFLVPEQTNPWE